MKHIWAQGILTCEEVGHVWIQALHQIDGIVKEEDCVVVAVEQPLEAVPKVPMTDRHMLSSLLQLMRLNVLWTSPRYQQVRHVSESGGNRNECQPEICAATCIDRR